MSVCGNINEQFYRFDQCVQKNGGSYVLSEGKSVLSEGSC